jgi:fructose-1,6-bisphosphatase/inositol monophosphatase family enzyme
VEYKNNDSYDPLTEADKASDLYLRELVEGFFPNDEILSEENDAKDVNYSQSVWMIDPLDGTKDFMK